MRAVALASRGTAARERYSRYIRSLAPLSYWRLNEPAGALAAIDELGSVHLTAEASPVFGEAGRLPGNAAVSVATGSLRGGNNFDFQGTAPFSIAIQIKRNTIAFQRIVSKRTNSGLDGWDLFFGSAGEIISFLRRIGGPDQRINSSSAPAVGVWAFIVGTYDGSTLRLYHDAAEVASGPSGGVLAGNADPFAVGSSADGLSRLNGLIDEPAVWDRALSADEVATAFALAAVY